MTDYNFYSDMFKGVHAKGVASALNELCEQGRLALFSADGEMLGYYPLTGKEFKAKQINDQWVVTGVPLSYCRFLKAGVPAIIKGLSWGAEVVFTSPTNCTYFEAGMDFESFITISY
jgi:hypothetical protein